MAGAERPEDEAAGPHTDRNPGTDPGEAPQIVSGARPTRSSGPPRGSDTLLSVPAPAARDALEERLGQVERKLEELRFRLEKLELHPRPPAAAPEVKWWPWLLFLAALALAWQIVALFR
jgi:hypothetical protein